MHESDSFISEVSEAVRRDRLSATLSRYGWAIIAAVVLIVGGAAVNAWLKAHNAAVAEAEGEKLRAALAETDPTTRQGLLGDIAASASPAAVLAKLAEAGDKAQGGDTAGAAALLEDVAGDGTVTELYRSLASLQRVMLLGSAMDKTERAATLGLLAADGAPFRPLALEQRALMHLDDGDKPGAIADLQALLAEPAASEALRGRARQLIVAAGGTVPAAAPAAALPPPTVDGSARAGLPPLPTSWLPRTPALALAVVAALAGCDSKNDTLPGERIPVRPEAQPAPGAARAHPLAVPAAVVNADWTHRNGSGRRAAGQSGAAARAAADLVDRPRRRRRQARAPADRAHRRGRADLCRWTPARSSAP